ncbi:MAG: hypothetical protein ACLPY1_16270 [Terracidiphilus sp.]
MDSSVKAQINQVAIPTSSPVSILSSSAKTPAPSNQISNEFEQTPVVAPEEQVSGNGSVFPGARIAPDGLSARPSESGAISSIPSQTLAQATSSGNPIQAMPSSVTEQGGSENGPVALRVEAPELTGTTNQQQQTPSPSAPENGGARIVTAVLPLHQGEALPYQATSGKENRARTIDGSPAAPAQIVNVHAASATQEAIPQRIVSRLAPDNATPQQTAMPSKPLRQTMPQTDSVNGEPATPSDSITKPDNQPGVSVPSADGMMLPIDLPIAATPADSNNGNQPTGNAVEKPSSSASGSRNPVLANVDNSAASKTTDTATGSSDTLQHGVQNAPQSSQSPQADPTHAVDVAPRAIDNGASQPQAQAQTVPTQAASPETAAAHRTPNVLDVAARSSEEQGAPPLNHSDGGEVVAASGINTAKLMQSMGESAMHVGMRSSEFGDISIRTSITDQQMVTRISLDHSELSQAISAHVSTMQTKLGADFGLNSSIEVHNLGSSHSGEPGQSSQREQRALNHSVQAGSAPFAPEEETGVSLAAMANAGNGNRLDIRA